MKKVIDSKPKAPSPKDHKMILGYRRYRLLYFFLVVVTIAMGLASRELSPFLPDWISLYAGDVLWATMVFFLVAFLFAKMPTYAVGVLALTFSIGIEFSQLYHAPWIDGLRATALGHLVLGILLWSAIFSVMLEESAWEWW